MPDELSFPHLWRFASKFRDRLMAASFAEPLPLPQVHWRQLLRVFSRLHFVQERKWQTASESLRTEATGLIWLLLRELEECQKSLSVTEPAPVAAVFEMVADLLALPNEFSDVRLDLKERKFSVVTDEIELEGIYLGRFRIVLKLDDLESSQSYFVEAVEPHPAARDRDLIHPHVRENRLCEGEGKVAIHAALRQGRLFDFFLLVRQILETYNSGSAYTSLEHWDGRDCSDCGRQTSEDDSTSCDRCSDHICFDCSSRCEGCDRYCCSTCYVTCKECCETVCNACAQYCSVCDRPYCSKCLSESTCSNCQDNPEPESDDQSVPNTKASAPEAGAAVAVHPLGVGEVAVPA